MRNISSLVTAKTLELLQGRAFEAAAAAMTQVSRIMKKARRKSKTNQKSSKNDGKRPKSALP